MGHRISEGLSFSWRGSAVTTEKEPTVKKSAPVVAKVAVHKAAPSAPAITAPGKYWQWKGVENYKNDFLRQYQQALIASGITDVEWLKWLAAQKIQEDGRFDPRRVGDEGCSLGHFQYNQCVHGKPDESFFTNEAQIAYMVDRVNGFKKLYPNSIEHVIQAHNCPACASGKRGFNGYNKDVKKHFPKLELK